MRALYSYFGPMSYNFFSSQSCAASEVMPGLSVIDFLSLFCQVSAACVLNHQRNLRRTLPVTITLPTWP